jgi:hypothetical protein
MTEKDLELLIYHVLLEEAEDELHIQSFEEAGVLTYNKGLVIRTKDGSEFQVTIVRSR